MRGRGKVGMSGAVWLVMGNAGDNGFVVCKYRVVIDKMLTKYTLVGLQSQQHIRSRVGGGSWFSI